MCQGESRARAEASEGCQDCRAVDKRNLMPGYSDSRRGPSHGSHGCSHACSGTFSACGSQASTALLTCGTD